MKFETLTQALDALHKFSRTLAAYRQAMGVLYFDATTIAPPSSFEGRGKTMEIMSQATYDLMANPELDDMLTFLESRKDELDSQSLRETEEIRKRYNKMHRIPADEYVSYSVLLNESETVWEKAKRENNYALFAPYLEKIVNFNRKFAGYYHPEMNAYDALLNEYEEGLNTETLDAFFGQLRKVIVPLLEKIQTAKPIDDSFLFLRYPLQQQKILSDYLMQVLGIDRNFCALAESEHPYTTGFNNKDVRITTHYYENAPSYSMYSVIHEGGHAIYEMGCDDCYNYTPLSGGVSMGIHESQSRFFENIIGRSYEFISCIFPKLKELFPEQLKNTDVESFYRAINKSQASLIRTEADELTYCLHIMVRYEIEKKLIAGSLQIKDVPQLWNKLYKEYLGIDVPTDTEGCLQDSHWAGGNIGYFPSYALGSAYGPQLLDAMEKEIGSIADDIRRGDLSRVKEWLHEHIHRHAGFYKPGELFENACGKFDAKYYTDYLTEKYSKLYHL